MRSPRRSRPTVRGAIYPVLYTRDRRRIVEHAIDPDPLMRFDTADARRVIADLTGRITAHQR